MASSSLATIVGRLVHRLPPTDGTADDALLARFAGWRDEAAFELLVYRHGPMVRGLCRRVLRHEQDAEDAFQATFLTLARKAGGLRGQSLAGWLHRVAFHVALKARAKSAKRERPLPELESAAVEVRNHVLDGELGTVLDEEILRLPERFRLPVVLCYLQGRSNREAAAALGIPKGTIDSRLSTARQKLRMRLLRRGIAPALAAAAIEGTLDAGELSGSVVRAVTKSAVAFISNQVAEATAAAVLAEGVLHTMSLTRIKWAMAAIMTVALLGSGAGVATFGFGGPAGDDPPAKAADQKKDKPAAQPAQQVGTVTISGSTLTVGGRIENQPQSAGQVRKLLDQPAGLDQPIENMPLRDVLSLLSDKFGVTIRIDPAALARFQVQQPFAIYDQPVQLPVVRGLTVGQILHDVLGQLPATIGNETVPSLSYKVKGAQIVIGPAYIIPFARTLHSGADDEEPPVALSPELVESQVQGDPISVDVRNQPLSEVLRELADATGANIVLDKRVEEKGQTPVTATLQNVRLFTVLRVLADMAELQPTTLGNVYYVTTKENAERLHQQEWLRPPPGARTQRPQRRTDPPAAKPAEPKGKQ